MSNTQDLSKLGYREIDQLADLLKAYAKNGCDFLNDEVKWEFNPMSDSLFLVDEDFNVAMLNDDKLEQWFNCPQCGHEGFKEDMKHNEDKPECKEYLTDIEA